MRLCFERLFEQYGLPQAIRSDNGAPFAHTQALFGLSRLSVWWVALGIDLERGRPGHPQDNGGHERMHRDIARELEPRKAEQAALDLWQEEFNHERPHEGLGHEMPGANLPTLGAGFIRAHRKTLIIHGMHCRRVDKHGKVNWQGAEITISGSLRGWSVGLDALADGKVEVWFGRLKLGWLERHTRASKGRLAAFGSWSTPKPKCNLKTT